MDLEKRRRGKANVNKLKPQNMFDVLTTDCDEGAGEVNSVGVGEKLTGVCAMRFNVADVAKPLASAVKVTEANNVVVLHPTEGKSFILNLDTNERIEIRRGKGTYVFDVQCTEGDEVGTVTLDSGASVSVWPKSLLPTVKMEPKKEGLRMVAANGTPIKNYGQKLIKFRGTAMQEADGLDQVFKRLA